MIMGVNKAIECNGITYHIQIEDLTTAQDTFEVRVYKDGGTVVFNKRMDYSEKVAGLSGDQRIGATQKHMSDILELTKAAVLRGRIS